MKLTWRGLKGAKAISVEHNRSHNSNAKQQQHNVSHCHHSLEREKEEKKNKRHYTTRDPLDRDQENEEIRSQEWNFLRRKEDPLSLFPLGMLETVKEKIRYVERKKKRAFLCARSLKTAIFISLNGFLPFSERERMKRSEPMDEKRGSERRKRTSLSVCNLIWRVTICKRQLFLLLRTMIYVMSLERWKKTGKSRYIGDKWTLLQINSNLMK